MLIGIKFFDKQTSCMKSITFLGKWAIVDGMKVRIYQHERASILFDIIHNIYNNAKKQTA
jgi:hypothetical protein